MKLIYHSNSHTTQTSNFDSSLLKVSTNAKPLKLASPYIGLPYLKRLIDLSLDWMLLSDIEAWLESSNRKHRADCWNFIVQNISKIRHVPQLHAKVAIGNNMLFLGSANFTNAGIRSRSELSILIDDHTTVTEASTWFDDLWRTASHPVIHEGDSLVLALNDAQWTRRKPRVTLSSSVKRIHSTLVETARPFTGLDVAKVMAEAGIEDAKIASLVSTEYAKITERFILDKSSFTFKYLRDTLMMQFPAVIKSQIYELISQNTVNHLPGGFDVDGFDQFVYFSNTFNPWNENSLVRIKPLDNVLAFIINNVGFKEKTYLPLESEWLNAGIPTHKILSIIDKLVKAGILIELDEAGDIERYSLDHAFEWPLRWKKFTKAHSLFIKKSQLHTQLIQRSLPKQVTPNTSKNSKENPLKENKPLFKKDIEYLKLLIRTDIKDVASKKKISFEDLVINQDQLIAKNLYAIDENGAISHQQLNELIQIFKNNQIPQTVINEFRNKVTGAFSLSTKDELIISKDWMASTYLFFYKEALKKWELIKLNKPDPN